MWCGCLRTVRELGKSNNKINIITMDTILALYNERNHTTNNKQYKYKKPYNKQQTINHINNNAK